ncbi:hypothetical protein ACG9X6_12135 [Acinetobacter guillouiae]|uniref:hypothetical protein n=1 Tax=Acinetobacter TaxID=469 RepID=UPI001FBB92B2|nr:hypothetical protein [Acinetobacter sp. NyZ410]UOH19048.1 hypothetical protein MTO68_02345 [Acinetobacter sp. NyZ410]
MKIQITEKVYRFFSIYGWATLIVVLINLALSHFQLWQSQDVLLLIFAIFILCVNYFIKINNGIIDSFLKEKKLPISIQIPVNKSSFIRIPDFIGFLLWLFALFSVILTWKIWLFCFLVSLAGLLFIEHPHVWFKDSFDWDERIKQVKNQHETWIDGLFNYSPNMDSFTFYNGNQTFTVRWSEIEKVDAVMIDQLSYQEVRLFILTKQRILIIDESMAGYPKFVATLSKHLVLINEYWLFMLMEMPIGTIVPIFQHD